MSVKEIYDRLGKCDLLESEARRERSKYDDLVKRVRAAIHSIDNAIRTYDMCNEDPTIDERYMFELDGRIDGLKEAKVYLKRAIDE